MVAPGRAAGHLPYYVTGALTASGGSWNASIVAEVVTGAIITCAPMALAPISPMPPAGNYPQVALGIGVMSLFVLGFNRLSGARSMPLANAACASDRPAAPFRCFPEYPPWPLSCRPSR
jgi:ABC-type anion transport system duplicated permease subunit